MAKFTIPKIKVYGIDIIKNLLFFILFIILTMLFIVFLISPSILKFKTAKSQYYETKYSLENLTQTYKTKYSDLVKLQKVNQKLLNAFKRDFNYENFKLFASKYMDISSVKEINSSVYKKNFIKTTYIMKAKIKSPQNFYDLIDSLKNYKSVLRIYFPIDFIKNKEDINLTLKLEHYKLKPR